MNRNISHLPDTCNKCIDNYEKDGQYLCTILKDPSGDPCQIPIIKLRNKKKQYSSKESN